MTAATNLSDLHAKTKSAVLRLSLAHETPTGVLPAGVVDPEPSAAAREVIRTWPGYAPTPLVPLPGLADALGVETVWCKDETGRFGLGSFKSLGGAFAVLRTLQDEIESRTGARPSITEVRDGHPAAAEITITTASAGNHGRGVAWGCESFGCGCVVFLPDDAIPERATAIESHGAEVRRFPGVYDEVVAHTEEVADREGWVIVSDTAYGTYEDIPRRVMEGYTLLADEMLDDLADHAASLTHLFVQAGVGGLAAGVCGHIVERLGAAARPQFIAIEPWRADCFGRSIRDGEMRSVPPPFGTAMGGLAAGVPSTIAWDLLEACLDAGLALPEDIWGLGARALSSGELGASITAGPSGASGVGALVALADLPGLRQLLGLDERSRVGVIVTETRFD